MKLTQKEAEEKVQAIDDGNYILLSKYDDMTKPAFLLHIPCKTKYEIGRLKGFTNEGGNRCPVCFPPIRGHSTKKQTEEDFLKRLADDTRSTEYMYISGFRSTHDNVKMKHIVCGTEYEVTPHMFFSKKRCCPVCANKKRGAYLRNENFLENVLKSAEDGNEYKWLEKYNFDNKEKIEILHKVCSNTYKVRPNDFQQGYRCPYCNKENTESRYSLYLKKLLKDNGIKYKIEKKFKSCKNVMLLPFDIYINEYNLLIEYDGHQHFVASGYISPERLKLTRKRDLIKNKWVSEHAINFLRIHYKIRTKKEILEIFQSIINNDIKSIAKKYGLYFQSEYSNKILNEESYYSCHR
jgi:hypothetical protein